MQIVVFFVISFAVIAFFMFVLSRKKTKSSCGCGQNNCQSGNECENSEDGGR